MSINKNMAGNRGVYETPGSFPKFLKECFKNIWSIKCEQPPLSTVLPTNWYTFSYWIQTQMTNRSIEFRCILLKKQIQMFAFVMKNSSDRLLENVLRVSLTAVCENRTIKTRCHLSIAFIVYLLARTARHIRCYKWIKYKNYRSKLSRPQIITLNKP